MKICFKGKDIEVKAKKVGFFGKVFGLMFKSSNTGNLLFYNFRGEIHSYFVFFPFVAVWIDSSNNVVDCEVVRPFRFAVKPKKQADKLIEIPLNSDNSSLVRLLVGRRKV